MPWEIKKDTEGKFCVYKIPNDEKLSCYDTRSEAIDYLRALYANEKSYSLDEIETFCEGNHDDGAKAAVYHLAMAMESGSPEEMKSHIKEALTALLGEAEPIDVSQDGYEYSEEDSIELAEEAKLKEYGWEGPITFEGISTGDGRIFKPGAIEWDAETLPWPFRWQRASTQGHGGAVPIGRVDSIERQSDGIIYGQGVVIPDLNDEAAEYLRMMESGVGSGVSVDGDQAVFEVIETEGMKPLIEFSSMRLRSLTAVDVPAFDNARIHLSDQNELVRKKKKMWTYDESLVASAIPVKPPTKWFLDPPLSDGPIASTVTKEGQVYGYLALFNTCHISFPGSCVTPPRNSKYQYFHTGEIETEEGDLVEVGHLTFNTGHASMQDSAAAAAAHYDNTGTVAADVRCGEDKHGIWFAGALRPSLTDEEIRAFRAAPLSGDWRRIAGRLELVSALAVNVPGFPVPRVRAMVASGETESLITWAEGECDPVIEDDSFSDYELDLRLEKKTELATRLKDFITPEVDEDVPIEKISDDELPKNITQEDVDKYAESYTKEKFFKDLKMIRELLDDPDEDMTKEVRNSLETLYSLFVKTDKSNDKKFAVNDWDLDEFYDHLDGFEASGLDTIEEFYNQCHDKGGKFCPTSGRKGGNISGKAFVKCGPGEYFDRASGGCKPKGGGGGRSKGGDRNKGGGGGLGTHELRQKSVSQFQRYRKAKNSAGRWAAAAAVAAGVTKSPLVASLVLGIAKPLLPPFLVSPAGVAAIAGVGIYRAVKQVSAARKAHSEFNLTVDRINRLEKASSTVERIRKEATAP